MLLHKPEAYPVWRDCPWASLLHSHIFPLFALKDKVMSNGVIKIKMLLAQFLFCKTEPVKY